MRSYLGGLVDGATDWFWGDTFKDLDFGGGPQPASEAPKAETKPMATGSGTTPEAAAVFSHMADDSGAAASPGPGVKPTSYDATTGLHSGNRPGKFKNLKGTDETGTSLTAHHLYPWNKISGDMNAALGSGDKDQLQKVLSFGDVGVDETFWNDFAKEPGERDASFGKSIEDAAQKICWSPANVFMGPLGNKRGDDPGEKLDAAFTKSGLPTPGSAVAEMYSRDGGIHKASPLTEMLARNVREAQDGEARPYDPREWAPDDKGKLVRRGAVTDDKGKLVKRGDIPLDPKDDSAYTPRGAMPLPKPADKPKRGKPSPEEIERLRAEKRKLRGGGDAS